MENGRKGGEERHKWPVAVPLGSVEGSFEERGLHREYMWMPGGWPGLELLFPCPTLLMNLGFPP